MSQAPHRIQRKRTRGWKMPPNTLCVNRPTVWGNPFKIAKDFPREAAVAAFELLCLEMQKDPELFQAWIKPLRGKNLACWCGVYDKRGLRIPCHADVLLKIANAPKKKASRNVRND